MTGYPQLVLDEGLFLQAIDTLTEVEGRDERFELLNVIRDYTRAGYVRARFKDALGRTIETKERDAIDYYVGAVYLVHHHSRNLHGLDEINDEFDPPTLDFIRTAAWAFLSAWTLRYGALYADLAIKPAVVDPTVRDPPGA